MTDQEVVDRVRREIEEGRTREERKRDLWGPIGPASMTRLCNLFPSLRGVEGTDPWSATTVLRWLCTSGEVTGGSEVAARFVLTVWNWDTDWARAALVHGFTKKRRGPKLDPGEYATLSQGPFPRPFNIVEAFGRWDYQHIRAFLAWAETPFFP